MPQIPSEYFLALAALAAGYIALVIFTQLSAAKTGREIKQFRKLAADRYFNIFFVFVLGWKLSPLVFQTATVLASPSALLYLPGGLYGTILGAVAALGYLAWILLDPRKKIPAEDRSLFRKALSLGAAVLLLSGAGIFFLIPAVIVPQEKAPDFSLTMKDGSTVSLETFRGKPVVLNIWASWCPPCRAEFPEMAAFQDAIGEGAVLLAVNAALTEKNPQDAENFLSGQRVNFPVAYDRDGRFQRDYGVVSLPTTVVIDGDGHIIWRRSGAISSEMLLQVLSRVEK